MPWSPLNTFRNVWNRVLCKKVNFGGFFMLNSLSSQPNHTCAISQRVYYGKLKSISSQSIFYMHWLEHRGCLEAIWASSKGVGEHSIIFISRKMNLKIVTFYTWERYYITTSNLDSWLTWSIFSLHVTWVIKRPPKTWPIMRNLVIFTKTM